MNRRLYDCLRSKRLNPLHHNLKPTLCHWDHCLEQETHFSVFLYSKDTAATLSKTLVIKLFFESLQNFTVLCLIFCYSINFTGCELQKYKQNGNANIRFKINVITGYPSNKEIWLKNEPKAQKTIQASLFRNSCILQHEKSQGNTRILSVLGTKSKVTWMQFHTSIGTDNSTKLSQHDKSTILVLFSEVEKLDKKR